MRRLLLKLPQAPEYDQQKRSRCENKSDEFVTVGVCVQLVMAVVGWMGERKDVVIDKHAGQMPEHFRVGGECTDYTRSHHHSGAQLWLGSRRNWLVMLEWPYHGTPRKGSGSLSMSR